MYPPAFEYHRAENLSDAIRLLAASGGKAKVLAGGHSLLPLMKLRLASPEVLVDIGRIGELKGVRPADGQLVVGALTTHGELAASGPVREHCPLLAEAAGCVGDLQVRNRGTIGGNLAHADPASDLPAVAVALGATLRLAGPAGSREVPAEDFFLGPLTTALGPDEILTEVRLPTVAALGPGLRVGSAYVKFPHPASGYAVVGVAAVVGLDAQDSCRLVRVGVTGAASRAFRARFVEQALVGRQLGPGADAAAVVEQACSRATEGVEVLEDLFAGREYRAHLCRVYVKRALLQALQRARGA